MSCTLTPIGSSLRLEPHQAVHRRLCRPSYLNATCAYLGDRWPGLIVASNPLATAITTPRTMKVSVTHVASPSIFTTAPWAATRAPRVISKIRQIWLQDLAPGTEVLSHTQAPRPLVVDVPQPPVQFLPRLQRLTATRGTAQVPIVPDATSTPRHTRHPPNPRRNLIILACSHGDSLLCGSCFGPRSPPAFKSAGGQACLGGSTGKPASTGPGRQRANVPNLACDRRPGHHCRRRAQAGCDPGLSRSRAVPASLTRAGGRCHCCGTSRGRRLPGAPGTDPAMAGRRGSS
jgi:hypothetical protein